jgi:flagellar hook-associated protein 3 FlgL
MVTIATRAQALGIQGVSDSMGAAERQTLGRELDGILQHAAGIGNTQHQGKYLFAGFKVNTQPYTYAAAGVGNNLASTADLMQQSIAPGQSLTVNVDGNTVFTPIFTALRDARDALLGDNIPSLQTALTSLEAALTGVNAARTTNGARQRQLDTAMDRLEQTKTALKNLLSHKEDVNVAEAISSLKQQETVYQAVLEIGRRAITPSLFDYLR